METLPQDQSASRAAQTQQLKLLLELGRKGTISTLTAAGVVVWVLRDAGLGMALWAWVAATLGLSMLRVVATTKGLRQPDGPWARIYMAGILGSGLVWGSSLYLLGHELSFEMNAFLAFVIAGVAAGSVAVIGPVSWLYQSYLLLVSIPSGLELLSRPEPIYRPMSALILLGAASLMLAARSYQRAVLDASQLGASNLALVDGLRASNEQLQAASRARELADARFRSAFEDSPIGMAFCDGIEIREANAALGRYFECEPRVLVGRSLRSLASASLSAEEQQQLGQSLEELRSGEYLLETCAHQPRWFAVTFARLGIEGDDVERPVVAQFNDITQAREMSSRLIYQARHDELTGLINRREFESRLGVALEQARINGISHALCMFDLDQFKVVNDTAGHPAGDELLRQIANTLAGVVRKTDSLARLGGDEFALLMERCTVDQAQRTAQAVRRSIENLSFTWGEKRFRVSASLGLVPLMTGQESVSDLLSVADAACFAAKEQGRNRVHVYRPSDTELVERQGEMGWVERINRAVDEDRFELWCQVIEPARIGVPSHGTHLEVLLRLREADGRLMMPGAFLPPAERYHVINRVDRWVIRNVLAWFAQHPVAAEGILRCGVNISGQSLTNDDFFAFLTGAMRDLGPLARKFCFEITETAAIASLGAAERLINELRTLGCQIALDDFGSGLSSFGYLKHLPIDFLKIDGLFVRDLLTDPVDFALVRAINEVGKTLGKATVAEFVENDEVRARLAELGVDFVQGYGIGRPRPLDDLA